MRERSIDAVAWPHGHVLHWHNISDVSSTPIVSKPPGDTTSTLVRHTVRHHEVITALAFLCVALAVLLSQAIERAEQHVHVDDLLDGRGFKRVRWA
jgi:hypothetical protein